MISDSTLWSVLAICFDNDNLYIWYIHRTTKIIILRRLFNHKTTINDCVKYGLDSSSTWISFYLTRRRYCVFVSGCCNSNVSLKESNKRRKKLVVFIFNTNRYQIINFLVGPQVTQCSSSRVDWIQFHSLYWSVYCLYICSVRFTLYSQRFWHIYVFWSLFVFRSTKHRPWFIQFYYLMYIKQLATNI